MDRHNSTYPRYSTEPRSPRTGASDVIEDYDGYQGHRVEYRYGGKSGEHVEDYDGDYDGDYDDGEIYEYVEPLDRRWVWVAGAAGAVLMVAVICTVVILGGSDSGSVSATVNPPMTTQAQDTAPSTTVPSTTVPSPRTPTMTVPPTAPLPPETVTTVPPSPSALPTPLPEAVPAPSPRTVTYQVTGTRQLIDLVTIIYTDNRGALQTDVNVALPWTKQIVLDPGVELTSVTATSLAGQLNCSIVDAAGAVIAAQTNNTMITTCTR